MSDNNTPNVLLRGEESDGHLAVVELTGRGRPPLHRHDFDETFLVLEGELTFQLGDELHLRGRRARRLRRAGIRKDDASSPATQRSH